MTEVEIHSHRDGYRWNQRTWIRDEQRGAPGVMFTWEHL